MSNAKRPALTAADLAQFTGSETVYRHSIARQILYTEGVQYVAERAGAYWLLDEIALNQARPEIAAEAFQLWALTVTGSRAQLRCEDGNDNVVFSKDIDFTDFPLPTIKIYVANRTILLPTEY
jgi:hypothetical protein